jgi:RNA polymerase sigma-70 factor, ECF subfamily
MDRESQFLKLLSDDQGRWRAVARSYAGGDVEDLLQEILLQIWRSLDTFRGESTGRTWCYRVALNTAMNWRRSKRTRHNRLPTQAGYQSELIPSANAAPAAESESLDVVHQLLGEQSPTDRSILLLLLDDVSYHDMAEILGTTEATLRVRIHRMKERIRKRYGGQFGDI